MNMGKPLGKHLDRSKREVIVNCLENNCTAKEIGELVNLDPTNVSREIKKRRDLKKGNIDDTSFCVDCANKKNCHKKGNCKKVGCKNKCVRCKTMNWCPSKIIFKCNRNGYFISNSITWKFNGVNK